MLGNSTVQTHFGIIVIGLATCGLGTGLFVSPNNSALMGAAPRNRQGIASGVLAAIITFMRGNDRPAS
ncbi:MAG: hypothetical protein KJ882_09065 [Proteobacteria bacterium]|nr:hypothetical protein [Pseudomonadota bacterium]MBU4010904.1 hypothetical protein [Pseudomonadota bacterium]MBU4036658.1 hypothetical protein [Pseudomonadota bacterium]